MSTNVFYYTLKIFIVLISFVSLNAGLPMFVKSLLSLNFQEVMFCSYSFVLTITFLIFILKLKKEDLTHEFNKENNENLLKW